MEIANSVMKRFRYAAETDSLLLELKFCLTQFQQQLTSILLAVVARIKTEGVDLNEQMLLLECMRLIGRIFFSLNWQTIPEFFEDILPVWMPEFSFLLGYRNSALRGLQSPYLGNDGVVEALQVQ